MKMGRKFHLQEGTERRQELLPVGALLSVMRMRVAVRLRRAVLLALRAQGADFGFVRGQREAGAATRSANCRLMSGSLISATAPHPVHTTSRSCGSLAASGRRSMR